VSFSRRALIVGLLAAVLGSLWAGSAQAQSPGQGPGGPVLVVADPADQFGRYYAEILRAEGLNEFAVADAGSVDAQTLAAYRVVLLAKPTLTDTQVAALDSWVRAGGDLVAMRPDAKLASLLGLGADNGDLANGYLQVEPGQGITGETMQFHDIADRWTLAGATPVATLYSNANTATTSPAVTRRGVGAGQAAAFTYDLARSIVYTRQGNPAWAGQKRDGEDGPIRSDDLFFGGGQPSWVDMSKVSIPQADEQQRLLANLMIEMSGDRLPLPRFWYLPRGEKAAVVMTGDDHDQGGTAAQFQHFQDESPSGCSVANWGCIRATSYVFPDTAIPNAAALQQAGFEIALHLTTGCNDFTLDSLRDEWFEQLPAFESKFPSLNAPATNRTHCIAWSDWASEPIVELENGVRLDTNYYYWPAAFVQNRPGMFTGSGMPMRFAGTDGSLIDVYQAATQMTDESGIDYETHIRALLDGALGPQGYYGVFTANMHTDNDQHPGADAIVAEAKAQGVPVVSARQMLEWLDGRNGSSFGNLAFTSNRLQFSIQRGGAGANGLEAMLPVTGPTGDLNGLTRGGVAVATSRRTVKGIEYEVFDAAAGDYVATYGDPPVPGVAPETTITAFTQTGHAAHAEFTADVPDSSFECRLDGGAFGACVSPRDYAGLASGQHTFEVRAIEPSGTPDPTPAARAFTVLSDTPPTGETPPGGGESGGAKAKTGQGANGGSDRAAPRIRVTTRRARMTAGGSVSIRATCPPDEVRCSVRLRLRLGRTYVGSRSLVMTGGQTRSFRIRLRRVARLRLVNDRSLRMTAVTFARDEAGNDATARTAVRLLAPRRR
jgi:hypothetical protein